MQLSQYLLCCVDTLETDVVTHGNVLLCYHGHEITSCFLDTNTCQLLLCGMFPQVPMLSLSRFALPAADELHLISIPPGFPEPS
jgi:hypothetical protein